MSERDFKTMGDMIKYYYDPSAEGYIAGRNLSGYDIIKDANVNSTVTGAYNPVYGAQVFQQFNNVANTLGVLPKFPMPRTGVRVVTAKTATTGTGGVSEDGTIPDTVKPTFSTFSRKPKEIAHTFSVSNRQQLISRMEDDAPIDMGYMREYIGVEHPKQINYMLLKDVTTLISAAPANRMESIDRLVSSYEEVTDCGDVDANDSDPYAGAIDRDAAASWADANVGENNNTNRALTLNLIRTEIRNIRTYGGNPTTILTGPTTSQKIDNLIDATAKYMMSPGGTTKAHLTANGLQTANGMEGGFEVATLFGLPIIEDADVLVDGAARIYILDTSSSMGMPKLGLAMAQPTSYYEYGLSRNDPSGINRLGTEGLYYTAGELHCSIFRHQAKLRDIEA